MEFVVLKTRFLLLYFATPKYLDDMHYYKILLELCCHISLMDLFNVIRFYENQIFVCLVTWLDYCLYVIFLMLSTFDFLEFRINLSGIILKISVAR